MAMNSLSAKIRQHPWYSAIAAVLAIVAGFTGVQVVGDDSTTTSTSQQTAQTSTAENNATDSSVAACDSGDLPEEAYEVIADITAGGPFEYPVEDGSHFGNYEGLLPQEDSQYYREYTVDTPGLSHRGARRIVTGGDDEDDPEAWYYTDDHYESFCSIQNAPQLAQSY